MFRSMLLTCVLILIIATCAFSHAPNKVEAEFDLDDQLLTVEVSHQVTDAAKHFVNKISIELNGEGIIEQKFFAQEDLKKQTVIYRIADAAPGDEIKVTAGCNISGRKKTTLKIEKKAEEDVKED